MIYGIGMDMIEPSRVKKSIETLGGFKERIFGRKEIEYCESKAHKFEHYAARFAAKEAFFKAIGTGWRFGIAFKEIQMINDALGKPSLKLSGKARKFIKENSIERTHVSVSHLKGMASAFVVLEKKE